MSGGHWGYQRQGLIDMGADVAMLLEAVGETERLLDYAICADTSRADTERKLFDLWEQTFDRLYDGD
jgi:hypothetical protein